MSEFISWKDGAVENGRIYDVSNLIFRINCAKHFSNKKSDTITAGGERGKERIHATGNVRDCKLIGFTKRDIPLPKAATKAQVHDEAIAIKVNRHDEKLLGISTPQSNRETAAELFGLTSGEAKANFSRKPCVTSIPALPNPYSQKMNNATTTTIILAVDATPTRVGGLLRLPGRERTIFYYSIDWTSHFQIEDSTKFEMINAALALELFEPYLIAYRGHYDKFVVKTDSHFYESQKGFKDPFDFEFLMKVQNKVKSLRGEFQHVFVSMKDPDIQNADYLSREELPLGLKINYNDDMEGPLDGNRSNNYVLVNLSSLARRDTLNVIREDVPGKYIKGYNYG